MAVQMTTDTVKNAKMTTESVANFVFFETLTNEKSANRMTLSVGRGENFVLEMPLAKRLLKMQVASAPRGVKEERGRTPRRRRVTTFQEERGERANFGDSFNERTLA